MKAAIINTLAVTALCAVSSASFATTYNGSCTAEPKSTWPPPHADTPHSETHGYSDVRVMTCHSSYEIYTRDKDGNKVELFVNPATASVVGQAGK